MLRTDVSAPLRIILFKMVAKVAMQMLLDCGASPDIKDLLAAAERGYDKVVQMPGRTLTCRSTKDALLCIWPL